MLKYFRTSNLVCMMLWLVYHAAVSVSAEHITFTIDCRCSLMVRLCSARHSDRSKMVVVSYSKRCVDTAIGVPWL
jgi:hypothetical protein